MCISIGCEVIGAVTCEMLYFSAAHMIGTERLEDAIADARCTSPVQTHTTPLPMTTILHIKHTRSYNRCLPLLFPFVTLQSCLQLPPELWVTCVHLTRLHVNVRFLFLY